ncbi:MAG TPA: hypothetical protein VFF06_09575 [Polyangia bacterium]|nr:hypothetical protein [Polyangia bacterium]
MPSLMALAAASASCGPAPANLHDALQQLTQVYCEAEFRCCSSAQAQAKSGVGDVSHCSMAVVPLVVQFGVAAQSAIDKGLYTYDGSAAALCIDGIRGALSSCGGPAPRIAFDANPICISMLVGKLQPGASCNAADFGGGCAPGSYCALGTCKLEAKAGEDCTSTACVPGQVCLQSNKCGVPLDDGQPCTGGGQCKSSNCTASACAPTGTVAQMLCN